MKYLLNILLFYIAAVSSLDLKQHNNYHLVKNDKCGTTPVFDALPYIAGGRYVSFGQYPWVAKIGIFTHYVYGQVEFRYCGGSIINTKYILSAAHCFRQGAVISKVVARVTVGDLNSTTAQDCEHWCMPRLQQKSVDKFVNHPDYRQGRILVHDISLVRLKRPFISYNDFVMPICLPFAFADQPTQMLEKVLQDVWRCCDFAGWGIIGDQNQTETTRLKSTKMSLTPCTGLGTKAYYICGFGQSGRPCEGDSGGTLSVRTQTNDGHYISTAVGIGSFINGPCNRTATIGFFTNVTKLLGWILDNIEP